MVMLDKPPRRASYLLSIWEERGRDPKEPIVWRFRVEDLHTRQQRGFATMAELLVYLQTQLPGQADEPRD